ncbi:MAG: hypothetical protein KY476_21240 [Planctomycetes bacterium]|nr:hypothetical protein [Planctomycetota bacterium]
MRRSKSASRPRKLPPSRTGGGRLAAAFAALVATAAIAQDQPSPTGNAAPAAAEASAAQPAANGAAAQSKSAPLPAGFDPPRQRPPSFEISKPLISQVEADALYNQLRRSRYSSVLLAGELNSQTEKILKDWARWRLHSMTLYTASPEDRRKIHDVRVQTQKDIGNAAKLQKDERAASRFRLKVLDEVKARAVELLDNNFYVRLNAAILLADLKEMESGEAKPAVGYLPAAEVLHDKVLADPNQHDALKIHAAKGLKRTFLTVILRSQQQRTDFARTLISELKRTDTHPWYQMRLVEALGALDLELSFGTNQPILLDALSRVAVDKNRSIEVRTEAAKALGRIPLPAGANDQVLAWLLVDLASQMADEYNKLAAAGGKGKAADTQWQNSFFRLYLAFKATMEEQNQFRGRKPGLLAKRTGDKNLADAYSLITPAVAHVLKNPLWKGGAAIPAIQVKAMNDWLAANTPKDPVLHSGLPPLTAATAADAGPTQPTSTTAGR